MLETVLLSSLHEVVADAEVTQVIALDELHFLEDGPEEAFAGCEELADCNLRVLATALVQSYRAKPFSAIMQLMAVAEWVDKFYVICVRCGAYSQRLIMTPANAPTIVVSDFDLYEARCRRCYEATCWGQRLRPESGEC